MGHRLSPTISARILAVGLTVSVVASWAVHARGYDYASFLDSRQRFWLTAIGAFLGALFLLACFSRRIVRPQKIVLLCILSWALLLLVLADGRIAAVGLVHAAGVIMSCVALVAAFRG